MDLLSDIPDFVRAEISSSSSGLSFASSSTSTSSFRQRWDDLGGFVERILCSETSFQELTLRDLLSSLPFGSVQATDTSGFWSSTAFPAHFKFTTFVHFQHLTRQEEFFAAPNLLFVLESPGTQPSWNSHTKIVQIPKITSAATFVFLFQHFVAPSSTTSSHYTSTGGGGGGVTSTPEQQHVEDENMEDEDMVVASVTYSAVPFDPAIHSVLAPKDMIHHQHQHHHHQTSSSDIDGLLERWKRGDTKGRSGKPTVEKIADLGGMTQLDLKKWLTTNGVTWTQMLIKHGFRDNQKSSS